MYSRIGTSSDSEGESAEWHVRHGPDLAPPLFTFIHQLHQAFSLISNVLPKLLLPTSVLSFFLLSSETLIFRFQPLPQSTRHCLPPRMTFVTSFPLERSLLRKMLCVSAKSQLMLHNTWVSELDHGPLHQSHHHRPPCT